MKVVEPVDEERGALVHGWDYSDGRNKICLVGNSGEFRRSDQRGFKNIFNDASKACASDNVDTLETSYFEEWIST